MPLTDAAALPYRPNVGVALFDAAGRVLIARRIGDDGPEVLVPGCEWQMPQGGIDPDEDIEAAARRELFEETGVRSATLIGAHPEWLTYDFPRYDGPPHKLAAFRGQRQRWFAMRFQGVDGEIDLAPAEAGAEPEFSEWRWERLDRLPAMVVPYKRAIYLEVARAFAPFAAGG